MIQKIEQRKKGLKPARYSFVVNGKPIKANVGSVEKVVWSFRAQTPGKEVIKYSLFPSEQFDLLKGLGFKENQDGTLEWDDEKVNGREFSANVDYVENERGRINPKTNKPYTNLVLSNFESETPF